MSADRSSRTPWWSSIITRTALVFAVFIVAASVLSGWLVYSGGRDQLLDAARQDMRHTLELARNRMETFSATMAEDIAFLADNAPLREFTAVLDTTDTAVMLAQRERIALLMESFLRSRPAYAQVRVIGADSLGRELIRFDRAGSSVLRVADSALQAKGDRDYYREAMVLRPGGFYFSPIDLNKEHGRIQVPWMPTLRAAAPLFKPDGPRAGIVVINADLRSLFADLASLAGGKGDLMLADGRGEVLLHPDTGSTFRFEMGGHSPIQALLREQPDPGTARSDVPPKLVEQLSFEAAPIDQHFQLATTRRTDALLEGMRRDRDRVLLIAGAVAALFVLLGALFAGGIASGLSRLTGRVEQYARGQAIAVLPVRRRDEVGRLARSVEHMQQRIDQRVNELELARSAAEASDAARRQFIANMSHEVRTPLNAIIGMATEIDATVLSEADRDRLALVQRSAQRLKGLVDDLLLHERAAEGRLFIKAEPADVRQLVMDVVRSHGPVADAKGLALRADVNRVSWCRVDALRLHQVLDNLVGNAVKYTQRGQVDVVAVDDGALHLLVSDTGPGLSEAELKRVFERFERAASSENDRSGAGLGLAITQRVVQAMGGSITARSTPGQGSRFEVVLPLAGEAPGMEEGQGHEVHSAIDPAVTRDLRVLYVEDVASNRMVLEQWSGKWQWRASFAATAAEAIALCESGTFDVLLLDLDLGEGMRGTQLGMRLRGLKRHRYVPMLAVTAYVGEEQQEEILRAGLNDRITKPLDRNELLEKVAWWTGRVDEDPVHVDTTELEAQYDNDAEKLLTVMNQYRRELAGHRIALNAALRTGDDAAISAVRHKLRPHWLLLGLPNAVIELDALKGEGPASLPGSLEQVFCACDRALMARQRELLAIAAGPAA